MNCLEYVHYCIPFRYTSKMLLAAIDDNHKNTYDFFYLPIDFKVSFSHAIDVSVYFELSNLRR